jgi:hypothetical protein
LTNAGTGYTLVGAVDGWDLTQTGTGYTTGTKSTTVLPSGGTGLTVDVVATDGIVTGVTTNQAGSGYSAGDVITITTGGANATFTVTKTDLTNVPTTVSPAGGTGLTVDIVVTNNTVTGVTINQAGSGYSADDVITITTGGANATFTVTKTDLIDIPTTVSPAGGTGLTVDVVVTNGIVDDVIVNQIGSGYSAGDVITITTGGGNATFIIKSISTDFTAIGASANTVGVTFTATGAGTGIGTARRVGQGANFTPFGSKIGGILKAIAVTPGVNYGKNTTVSSQEKTTPWTTAKGIARTDIIVDFDGKYLDSRGFLSGDSVVQDGRLYTPWSYVVGSDMEYEEWVGPISKIAHPVGTKIFPTYYINTTTSAASASHSDVIQADS